MRYKPLGWVALLASCAGHPAMAAPEAAAPGHTPVIDLLQKSEKRPSPALRAGEGNTFATPVIVEKEKTSTPQLASWAARIEKQFLTPEGELSKKGWMLFIGTALCSELAIRYVGKPKPKDFPLSHRLLQGCCEQLRPIFALYPAILLFNRWVRKKSTPLKNALIGESSSFALGWWQAWVVMAVLAGAEFWVFSSLEESEQKDRIQNFLKSVIPGLKLDNLSAEAVLFCLAGVVEPICKEIIYRGLPFQVFPEHGAWLLMPGLLIYLTGEQNRKLFLISCMHDALLYALRHKSSSVLPGLIREITFLALRWIYHRRLTISYSCVASSQHTGP